METKLPSNCNQCPNACPSDALKCGRGKAYFRRLESGETEFQSEDALVMLLYKCGQVAGHKSKMLRQHGAEERNMFRCLSDTETEQLESLLRRLNDGWEEEHRLRHQRKHD